VPVRFSHGSPWSSQAQTNQRVWTGLISDERYSSVAGRVETNRDGEVLLSPAPPPRHGRRQAQIGIHLEKHLPQGFVLTGCPVSTSEGVKVTDVAWFNSSREEETNADDLPERAPDICVEVVAPSDNRTETDRKRALYFGAGAVEVWICDQNGRMDFFSSEGRLEYSQMCSDFPRTVR
jgi:Uma2 family endonuclease